MKFFLTVVAAFLIVACNPTSNKFSRAEYAQRAKTEMIGKSQAEVLSCMGPPANAVERGDQSIWSYASGGDRQTAVRLNPYAETYTATAITQVRSCIVNVEFKSGVVKKLNYIGRTGGLVTEGEQCAFAVSNCL